VICNFYGDTGRQVERIRLLHAIVADCLDVETLTSLKGREECWLEAISRGLQLGMLEHDFAAAERFYSAASKHLLVRIGDAISRQTRAVSEAERDLIKEYIDLTRIWIGGMVASKVRANLVAAATLGERAFDLACRFDYHEKASQVAFHLGHCYLDIPGEGSVLTEESNLLAAEKWYERSLNWTKAENAQTRSMILFELAQTRYRRMQNAVRARAEAATIESLINDAMQAALEAERTVAPEFIEGRARVHHLLGNIFDDAGSLTRDRKYTNEAVNHYQEYIKLADRMGDLLDAAVGCREMARLRLKLGEFDDALVFAQEAVRKCEKVGPGGQVSLDRSRGLLRDIALLKEKSMGAGS
jgi:tetratricopeptide (TPR) repeat protein